MLGAIIVSGGTVDEEGMLKTLRNHDGLAIIAADRGVEVLMKHNLIPDYVIGDFDSVSSDMTLAAVRRWDVPTTYLKPEKDDTDTEAALRLAFQETKGDIVIFGGTGSRLDHVLANISILGLGFEHGRTVFLQDGHNRIRLLQKGTSIKKKEQYGKYLSFFPFSTEVTGLNLLGFKYELKDYTMTGYNSLGVSNEIVQEEACVTFQDGVLIMIESRD